MPTLPALFPSFARLLSMKRRLHPFLFIGEQMSVSAKIFERFRKRLVKLVAKEHKETGCQAVATKRVASKIGVSPMWVRRVVGNYGGATIQACHYVAVLMLSFGGGAKKVAGKFCGSAQSRSAELNA